MQKKVRLRRYYDLGVQMQQSVVNAEDVEAFADMAESRLFELRKFKEEVRANSDGIVPENHRLTGGSAQRHRRRRLAFGVHRPRQDSCGFRGGALYTIAARPGMKSTLAMNIAEALAVKADVLVAVFSLEMSEDELNQRMLGSYSSINLQRFINHDYDKAERNRLLQVMAKKMPALNKAPVFINPRTDITINQLRAEARRFVKKGAKLVIVDYLQLVSAGKRSSGNRVQEVGEISRGLKKMALELDVPVIALAQLNRAIEQDRYGCQGCLTCESQGRSRQTVTRCCSSTVRTCGEPRRPTAVPDRRRQEPQRQTGNVRLCFVRDFSRFEDWRDHQDLVDMAKWQRASEGRTVSVEVPKR